MGKWSGLVVVTTACLLLPDPFVRGQEDGEGLRGSHLQLIAGHWTVMVICHKKSHQLLLDQPGPLPLLSKPKGRGCGRHSVLPNPPAVTQLLKPEKWISEEPVAWLINEWHWMTPGWACVEEKCFSAVESLDAILRNQYKFNRTLVSRCLSWTSFCAERFLSSYLQVVKPGGLTCATVLIQKVCF